MPAPNLINRNDLLQWANTMAASSELPRLVRRLILETGSGVVQLDFPSGEGVRAGDWDGTLRVTKATPYIPLGLSGWELSVEKSPGVKANRDYAGRDTTPDGSPTNTCTYVELILRPWPGRRNWARERSAEGKWREVRALGVDDLESWLESAPITHAWISQVLGRNPYGLQPVDLWWDAWSQATTPTLEPAFMLAGRKQVQDQLLARLQGPAQVTTISGGSQEEIQAFIAAVILQAEAAGTGQLNARAALVDDLATWRELLARANPLILIAASEQTQREPAPPASEHHIVVPLIDSATADIEIPRLDPTEAAEVLKQAGVEGQKADRLARLARRSLLAMRREIANKPELHRPSWSRPPTDRSTRGLLLAGRWNDSQEGDKEVLADLSGEQYDVLREAMTSLSYEADPLVSHVGPAWALVSSHDAWRLLAKQVRADDLGRLSPLVLEVLGEVDPSLDLPKEERWWRASMEGKVSRYSSQLRKGLTSTLALLGVYGEDTDAGHGKSGANWAADTVRELLSQANAHTSCKLWITLSGSLPVLAEAAPDEFLAAVDKGLDGQPPLLSGLFEAEVDGPIGGSAPHTGLLWALETTAWSDQHFGQSVELLARLAHIDPGGRLSNRPAASLAAIFSPWHPDNSVDAKRRLDVLDAMRERHPSVAWDLMITMLPEPHGIHFPTREPTYRGWKPAKVTVTNIEYFQVITGVVARLVQDADGEFARWAKLIEKMANLSPPDRETVLQALEAHIENGEISEEDKPKLWESLRSVTAQHREYSEAPWALPPAELEKIDRLQSLLQPDSPINRHAWLFQDYTPPVEGYSIGRDYQAYEAAVAKARMRAVAEIDNSGGYEALLRLAEMATQAEWVGVAIADATEAKYESELVSLLESPDAAEANLSASYLARRFDQAGWPWLEGLLERYPALSAKQQAISLLQTRNYPKAWQRADELGVDVARQFWSLFRRWGLGDFQHTSDAAQRLMKAGRNVAALDLIQLYMNREDADVESLLKLGCSALEAIKDDDHDLDLLRLFTFEQFFSSLYEHEAAVGWERIARLEWMFLPALGYDADPKMLGRLLANDPNVFVELVSAAFRSASEDQEASPTEEERNRAMNAYRLLAEWSAVPGTAETGDIDGAALSDWVSNSLRGLEETDRLKIGTQLIGRVLAKASPDPDGSWPRRAIRDVLQSQRSEELENGFFLGVLNSRGVTSRSLEEGGALERSLASKYREYASQCADQWPRVASLLRSLADYYDRDARGEDNSAELFRRGLDE